MALTPLEALNRVIEDRVADVRLTGFRTLANLMAAGSVKTAKASQINWDVRVGGAAATWEAMTANGAATATGDVVPASLTVGAYRLKHQFPISKVAIEEAASRAPEDLADLLGAHVDEGVTEIMKKLNQALYTADGTAGSGGMFGLNRVYDNTLAYAGIDPVAYPRWKALTLTNGTARAFTRDLMLDFDEMMSINSGMYNMVLAHPTTSKAYTKVFDTIGGAGTLPNEPNQDYLKRVDLGHAGRFFNGFPIVEDPDCPVGSIRTLYTPSIYLHCFELTPSSQIMPGLNVGQHIVNRSYGLPLHIAELPSNNSAVRNFELFVIPQLQVRDRTKVGGIMNLL